jgi:chaperonin GroEL
MLKTGKFEAANEDTIAGVKMLANICEQPLRTIVDNTGFSSEVVANELVKRHSINPDFRIGYNAATGKYTNLIEEGIIDPVKVTRYALEHAASVVGLMLTCNCVVVNENDQ